MYLLWYKCRYITEEIEDTSDIRHSKKQPDKPNLHTLHLHAPTNPTCSRWYDLERLKADFEPDSPPSPCTCIHVYTTAYSVMDMHYSTEGQHFSMCILTSWYFKIPCSCTCTCMFLTQVIRYRHWLVHFFFVHERHIWFRQTQGVFCCVMFNFPLRQAQVDVLRSHPAGSQTDSCVTAGRRPWHLLCHTYTYVVI